MVTKSQYTGGNCLKIGAWTVCRVRGISKKRRVVFLKRVDTSMHNMYLNSRDKEKTYQYKNCFFKSSLTIVL